MPTEVVEKASTKLHKLQPLLQVTHHSPPPTPKFHSKNLCVHLYSLPPGLPPSRGGLPVELEVNPGAFKDMPITGPQRVTESPCQAQCGLGADNHMLTQ